MRIFLQLIISIFIIQLYTTSCAPRSGEAEPKQGIMVSIGPQAWFVRQLLPDSVPVHLLVPPGASPHAFEPGPADLVKMDQALAYLRIGHIGFELALADKLHGMYPDKPIFDLSENVPLIVGHCQDEGHDHSGHDHSGEGTDPHIWMSVSNARIIAQNSRNALVEVLPGLQQEIDQNFERLQLDLDTLDQHIRQTIETSDVRSFAIFHPSLAYFSEEYGLEQIAIEDEGKDPSAAHLRLVMDQIKQKGIRTILVQREFNQEQALVIAKEAGLEIRVIDPLSAEWRESIVSIVDAIIWQP